MHKVKYISEIISLKRSSSYPSPIYKISIAVFFFSFLELHLRRMEVPTLGVESEMQLLAYATATVMPDLSHICDLHHSSLQRRTVE